MGFFDTLAGTPEEEEESRAASQGSFLDDLTAPPDPSYERVKAARRKNPDEAAERNRIADEIGMPTRMVEEAPETTRNFADMLKYDEAIDNAPATQEFLRDPRNLEIAHDSVEQLSYVEGIANGLVRGWLGVKQGARQWQADRSFQKFEDSSKSFEEILKTVPPGTAPGSTMASLLEAMNRWATTRLHDPDEYRKSFSDRQKQVGELLQERSKYGMSYDATRFMRRVEAQEGFLNKLAAVATDPVGVYKFSSEVGMEVLPMLLAAGLVTAGTRNPVAGATAMGIMSGATERYRAAAEFLQAAGVDLTDRRQLDAILTDPKLMREAQEFGLTRGAIIGTIDALSGGIAAKALSSNPVVSLLLQTFVAQPILGGSGEAAAQLATTGEINLDDVIFEAVGELAFAPVEVSLVGGRPVARPLLSSLRRTVDNLRAKQTAQGLKDLHTAAQASPLHARSPEAAAAHTASVMEENGATEFYIPIKAIRALENGEQLLGELGVTDQAVLADQFDGDVTVDAAAFSRYVVHGDPAVFNALVDHIRTDAQGNTSAEADIEDVATDEEVQELDEAQESISQPTRGDEVLRNTTPELFDEETEQLTAMAEHEVGFQEIFKDAKSSGMSESTFASYLEAIKRAFTNRRKAVERAKLRREQRAVQVEFRDFREGLREETTRDVRQQPVYAALQSLGVDRLDRAKVLELLNGDSATLRRLPRAQGRPIYSQVGQTVGVMDPEAFAEMWGFESADIMLFNMLDSPNFKDAIELEMTRRAEQQMPTQMSLMQKLEESLEALSEDDSHGTVLAFELARLRQMRGEGRLRRSLVRQRAAHILTSYRVFEINPGKLEAHQRRQSRYAAQALRAGDIEAAAQHKLNQLLAYEMTRQSYRIEKELTRGNKAMRKIQSMRPRRRGRPSAVPIEFLERAQELLENFQFGRQRRGRDSRGNLISSGARNSRNLQRAIDESAGPDVPIREGESLGQWKDRKQREEGIVMTIGPTILDQRGRTHWENLTLDQWRALHVATTDIVRAGEKYNRILKDNEESTREQIVAPIAEAVRQRISGIIRPVADQVSELTDVPFIASAAKTVVEARRKWGLNAASLILNTDSLLRAIDGFESIGPAYKALKGGIDGAYYSGYHAGQIGYMPRSKEVSEKLNVLFDMFSKDERNRMNKRQHLPGVRVELSPWKRLGVLLNMGNAENIKALVDSGEFTQAELDIVVSHASKRDMDFVQAVWDLLDSFRPDIVAAVRRRQNRTPRMVQAQELVTQHGTYKGGYFPLSYDTKDTVLPSSGRQDIEEMRNWMLRGGYSQSHTYEGYTYTRDGSGGKRVKLDPFVINTHVNQVLYDLEMGDAVHDSYKILHSPDLIEAFNETGSKDIWDALDVWLDDAITGEVHRSHWMESLLRHARTGTTVTKLAFNVTTSLLQPLGLLQSATLVGKGNMLRGLWEFANPQNHGGPMATASWVSEQSPLMAERSREWNKDIQDATRNLQNSFLRRAAPGKSGDVIIDSMFLMITKMQRFVDLATWLGARRQGTEMFPEDPVRAQAHADRMVARTQGTGVFHERTAFERGTLGKGLANTEMVRMWSLFLSYFAAKANVAYERTKTARVGDLPNLKADDGGKQAAEYAGRMFHYATDMVLLYMVEGMIAHLIRSSLDDDDDNNLAELASIALNEGRLSFFAGIPILREAATASQGFEAGGVLGSLAGDYSALEDQVKQVFRDEDGDFAFNTEELDWQLFKATNSLVGVLAKIPSSQVNKTGDAIMQDLEHDDVNWWEFITGVRRNR